MPQGSRGQQDAPASQDSKDLGVKLDSWECPDLQDPQDALDPAVDLVPGVSRVLGVLKGTWGISGRHVPPMAPPLRDAQDRPDNQDYRDLWDPRERQAAPGRKAAEEIEETLGSVERRVLLVPAENPERRDHRERGERRAAEVTTGPSVTPAPPVPPAL